MSRYYNDSNKLVVGKMKFKMGGVAVEEFAGLKEIMYPFLVDDSSQHKKAKGVKENVVQAYYEKSSSRKNCFILNEIKGL